MPFAVKRRERTVKAMMNIEMSEKEFRRLLDLVYVGNWVMNAMRGENRIREYDEIESKCFSYCLKSGMYSLFEIVDGEVVPSAGFEDGGIQEAIMDYEDCAFFDILSEELARRDMSDSGSADETELMGRIEDYRREFDENGLDHVSVEMN